MVNVLISGINGNMGRALYANKTKNTNVSCGVDLILGGDFDCPVYKNFSEVKENVDVVIDFSSKENTVEAIKFCSANGCRLLVGTTGLSDNEVKMLEKLSRSVAVFYSSNTSLGINLLLSYLSAVKKIDTAVDADIIEKHRKTKKDAPSGTAITLKKTIEKFLPSKNVNVHSIRAGNVSGEHEIIFTFKDESISIKHTASSPSAFAVGAIKIAEKLASMKKGLYTEKDFIRMI